jgi:hypothetical protein
MSEETNNEGGLSGLKKTLIGTLTTVIGGAGIWVSTTLFGGHSEDKEEVKTEQVAPAPAAAPVINVNLENNNTNQQKQQSNNSNTSKAAPAPVQQATPAPAPAAQKESW